MIRRGLPGAPRSYAGLAALVATALFLLGTTAGADPLRVALVRDGPDVTIARETAMRLEAELRAAGYEVTVVDAPAQPATAPTTVTILSHDGTSMPEVWVASGMARRRVEIPPGRESSTPAALAIRAVELLRASLLEPRGSPLATPAAEREPADGLPHASPDTTRAPRRERRALFEGVGLEVGLAGIYGLGDTTGRLAPTLRVSYGSAMGLAGRVTVIGPTSSDQLMVAELAYAFDRWWRMIAPVVSLGAGAMHTHLDDTVTPRHPHLETEAWAAVASANAGVAVRAARTIAVLVDGHGVLAVPTRGAVVGMEPASLRPMPAGTISLGVLACF
jgi:hypothetical protein